MGEMAKYVGGFPSPAILENPRSRGSKTLRFVEPESRPLPRIPEISKNDNSVGLASPMDQGSRGVGRPSSLQLPPARVQDFGDLFPPPRVRRPSMYSRFSRSWDTKSSNGKSRLSFLPGYGYNDYRPLSFRASIWLKDPNDFVLQFQLNEDDDDAPQSFDPSNHSWSRSKKKRFVYVISLAAMFSPLSSNIYFPALNAIAAALKVSTGLVALSITVYMLVQGLAPSFWGPLADSFGRRPILLSTLVVYLIANASLALPGNYAVLMVFRGLQAAGSASTIAIGSGVIGDIADAEERGGFMGLFGGSTSSDSSPVVVLNADLLLQSECSDKLSGLSLVVPCLKG